MHTYQLDTPRLTLRPLTQADADAAFVWCSDPVVNRYMPYTLYTRAEDVRTWLASVEQAEGEYNFGFVRKSDGLLIGSGSIGPDDEIGCWVFGYNLRRDCWNQGYATEAAQAMIDFAVREFGVRRFSANHAIANPASGRVMEKCGLVLDHLGAYSRFDGSETFPARYYRLTLDQLGRTPRYTFAPMTQAQFDTYHAWTYPAPYTFYNNAPEHYAANVAEYLAAPENWFAALDDAGRMAGMAEYELLGNCMEIGLGLAPEYTDQGAGEQFARACIAHGVARYHWQGKLLLRVADFNIRAQKVYERLGFRAKGTEAADCFGQAVTFIRMVRDDGACNTSL